MTDAMNDPYERLAEAIILQAVKDYCAAVRKFKYHPKNIEAKRMIEDCGGFFRSDWFAALTDIDGQKLENRILESMNRPKERRRRRRKKTREARV